MAGLGIALATRIMAGDGLRTKRLTRLLGYCVAPAEVRAIFPAALKHYLTKSNGCAPGWISFRIAMNERLLPGWAGVGLNSRMWVEAAIKRRGRQCLPGIY